MNRRIRPVKPNPFHKFLKPGALAKLRDSQITARRRFHRLNSLSHIPSPLPPNDVQPQQNDTEGFPCFVARIFSPRCPQRKKLMASKSVYFVTTSPIRSVADSPDSVLVESLGNDVVVAN
ncbi:hypothetical protein TanjilG_07224 [Lupinus angustifolius]|uniref:Uncharacterized protein n=1 Tax=Lupinus angustifolius TaxID=3871 RepID=A0A1J7HZG7_LUPAN|nr:PREDICTED: uncharacterized protein LOC109353500 [Lupinus angustifolius]XP_019451346.1 PREDICTED: uncharacterized protein LOC109353501 [Lupinus angustifolius]OIW05947.1 hypothetical protein TanjilG_07223 [Lupinus angustifolius]OIW05948.1 hypothetical protein TanjilG_07224 [Lupinus angustifolius]